MIGLPGPRQFTTTQWSLVRTVKTDETSLTNAKDALEQLCRSYWYPLYAFVRSRGYSAEDSQDLTQAFFTELIDKKGFASADQTRGRFRSYLLGAMKHFLANEWNRGKTKKRGGDFRFIEWDSLEPEARYARTYTESSSPEHLFDQEWALETITAALQSLRSEMERAGKGKQFQLLKGSLTLENEISRQEIAERQGMSEDAVKVAIHRLRKRYRKLLRDAIAETVSSETDLDEEMRYLVSVLRRR